MSVQRGYFTADEVRAAEAELFTRVPEGMPMQRAAHGLATIVAGELRARTGGIAGRAVTLLVGSGDNGGDALWAGAKLRRRGVEVTAVLLDPARAHAKGLAALRASGGRVREEVGAPDLVIDGIVGISGRGPLRPRAAELVAGVRVPIVAADLPSGVDPDTGAVSGPAVRAAVTVAFGAYKPVHALAAPWCGRIELVPIGLELPEPELAALEPAEIGARWPVPGATDDKYTQGVTGICAGSATYPGAAVLCTGGAVAATSGMVRYAGTGASQVLAHFPEVIAAQNVSETGRVQSWVFGPGAGTDADARARLEQILATDLPTVVDADGLTLLAAAPDLVRGRTAPTVLTPHAGEFARLTGQEVGADRVGAVRDLAEKWQVTVLLKGRATLVAAPGSPVLVNEAGGSWAATAGAGDVLSGVIGALLAAGRDPAWSAAAAARAHALAANLAAHENHPTAAPTSASPLLAHIRAAIRTLRSLSA
ncbi:yjeF C-terminal region, hydroxyethylthiazole kinase-related/yjeF N-terminal region [Nocardia amikacinitolerans]|uniref:ADP-dependent (S)-NAD(P)H-hydrate dehydratase n=1 Tax=Nocardia amikacinitolerans TaxID=756689 RepID=A0A285LT00_9NOCA|nr:NAD(P)H-hydrate dehydratase [Nocardia amikacinitolerans]SNY88015.1 yjeF C-terminal region, hydroxyethylthiazole kinase-related/yjeF N-terminal region [Nocardia amikacinitolerans]